jgi:hypothetical protein
MGLGELELLRKKPFFFPRDEKTGLSTVAWGGV